MRDASTLPLLHALLCLTPTACHLQSPHPQSSLPQACLHRAVNTLSREMARSFADQGEDLPPWRTAQALLSRWQLGGSAGASGSWAGAHSHAAGAELFAKPAFGAT